MGLWGPGAGQATQVQPLDETEESTEGAEGSGGWGDLASWQRECHCGDEKGGVQQLSEGNAGDFHLPTAEGGPTAPQESRLNCKLKELQRDGEWQPPYGLPKIHKTKVPLRPIVSFLGSPSYPLVKQMQFLLSPLESRTDSHVRGTPSTL